MALDVWCRTVPSKPFFFVAPEDRGGQQQHGPASFWQVAEVIAIVQRTREATRSSAFACELRAADSPRPLAFISNVSFLDSRLVQGWPQLRLKGDFLQYSGPLSRSFAAWLKATDKTLRDGVTSQKGSFQESGEGANEIHGCSSSPWVTNLSSSPDSLVDSFEKFMAASLPALAGASSHIQASRISDVVYRCSSMSSAVAGVALAVADGGFGQVRGGVQDGAVEVLRGSSPVEDAGTRSWTPRIGVVGACGVSDYGGRSVKRISWCTESRQESLGRACFSSVSLQWVELDFVQFFALSSARCVVRASSSSEFRVWS